MKKSLKPNGAKVPKVFNEEELKQALIVWSDLMERCLLPYLVGGKVARCMVDDKPLESEQLDVIVVRSELTDSVKSTMHSLAPDIKIFDDRIEYKAADVPVVCKIVNRDDGFYENPDFKFYWSWEYNIPNSFEEYWKQWKQ